MTCGETKYYSSHDRLYISVDCIVFALNSGNLQLLLIRRDFEPFMGELSLIGGFVKADESVDAAAQRVLYNLTGLDGIFMYQIGTFGNVDRDPGERVISVAYAAILNYPDINHKTLESHNICWVNINDIPNLILDHNEMVKKAIQKIRHRSKVEPLVFRLLPQYFTLTQLQQLYETLLGEKLDKRNFRRRVLENKSIVSTDMVDKETSRRGARQYVYVSNLNNNE